MAPQAVVFDLGKVLLNFDYRLAARKLADRGARSTEEIARFLLQTPILLQYETGLIGSPDFYKAFCTGTGYRGSLKEFALSFGDIFSPVDEMIELQAQLRRRSVPTYIFSNTNELAVEHIREHYPFFRNFDGYILSYEHGSMKPDARLYEVLENTAARRGPELLYIDDRPENVEAGAARNWQTILHECPAKTRSKIVEHGLLG